MDVNPAPEASAADRGPIRVLIADDQALFRECLRIAIDREPDLLVVGEAATGTDAVFTARAVRPDVILMDIQMPEADGISATREIVDGDELAGTRVLVLTMHELDDYVVEALRAGASGFLLKDATPARIASAIRSVHGGEASLAPGAMRILLDHHGQRSGSREAGPALDLELTAREVDVLKLVGAGLSNAEIADKLTISINTVKTHIGRLHTKLMTRDRAQLAIASRDHGFS